MSGTRTVSLRALRAWILALRDLPLLRASDWFDGDWYRATYPDAARSRLHPAMHYLLFGAADRKDPGPKFSGIRYLQANEDVRRAAANPLVHYLRHGMGEGRAIWPRPPQSTAYLHTCPVCLEPVDFFLPFPEFYTDNRRRFGYPYSPDDSETMNTPAYSCPRCGATDRDRLYALYLERRMAEYPTNQRLRLLDIAPSVPLTRFISRISRIEHTTADRFMEGVDMVLDITRMPEVQSNTHDILICSHVLEHVQDDRKALSELFRVLRPGGWAILMVPIIIPASHIDEDPMETSEAERWRRFGQFDHVRLYNKSGFVQRVQAAGFEVEQLGLEYFGPAVFEAAGIAIKSVLYVGKKSS